MKKNKDAQIVLRVAADTKNALVKASQAEGEKLTDWMLARLEGTTRFGPTRPTSLNMAALPDRLAGNWHIHCTVRSDAQVRHAQRFAAKVSTDHGSEEWLAAFEYAALDWLHANPSESHWATGRWPDGASNYLGQDALEEARRSLGLL